MIPLSGPDFPANASELEEAIRGGLSQYGLESRAVTAEDAGWPKLKRLGIDLSGASATRSLRLPAASAGTGAEIQVEALELKADPIFLEGSPALRLTAQDARLREAESAGAKLLVLEKSGPGKVLVSITREELQAVALTAARAAAEMRGAQIQDLQIALRSESERAVRFEASAVAKMGFMKAELTITGRAELDEHLQLWLSDLDVKGNGMAASLAAGVMRPQLEKLQLTPISLALPMLGTIQLRDARLTAGETVRMEAEFSS